MIKIDKTLLDDLFAKAKESERKRMNYDMRTSSNDSSQRMLNALLPGTKVAIHHHPISNENVLLLCGKLEVVVYEEVASHSHTSNGEHISTDSQLVENERILLDPEIGNFGCVVPAGAWHTIEVIEPSVIYDGKDGRYGMDGTETW